jgi:hypothetical protein
MTLPNSLGAPVGPVLVVYHQRICPPGGILLEGDFSTEVAHKEPCRGFGKRLELILAGGLDEQPRSARPDHETDCTPGRRRASIRADVGDEDLWRERDEPPPYQRMKRAGIAFGRKSGLIKCNPRGMESLRKEFDRTIEPRSLVVEKPMNVRNPRVAPDFQAISSP